MTVSVRLTAAHLTAGDVLTRVTVRPSAATVSSNPIDIDRIHPPLRGRLVAGNWKDHAPGFLVLSIRLLQPVDRELALFARHRNARRQHHRHRARRRMQKFFERDAETARHVFYGDR